MNAEPQLYDFRSPSRFSREQLRALQMATETFARQMATILSTTLRIVAHANLEDVVQTTYDEYIGRVPNPSLLAILNFAPLEGDGVFQLPMDLVMSVIDRLLGGPGTSKQPSRALSEIESGLIRSLVKQMVWELRYAFESLGGVKGEVQSMESDPQFLQLAPPSDAMIVAEFEIKLGDQTARSTLCIPVETIAPVLDSVHAKPEIELSGAKAEAAESLKERMHEVPVEVRVAFAPIALPSRDILDLEVGDVLPLHHPTNQPLTLEADGIPVATAVPGSHGKRLACQIVTS
ncbi:flagellar motor switch protein FliM [Gephyromycinifex aptenodytis]|uniref:flagellar motor switch protein FliM n=1 Tax=Gephyromycinifex aptenodytis TaxID=2716227 RepID=UPI0014474EBD|nr:flagellar motor switch protein FliM [Gephyromycinifex aptenodytis]